MSRRRRQDYDGCSINRHEGRLRLRYRMAQPDGTTKQDAWATGRSDTPENRAALEPLAKLVGALLRAGKDPRPELEKCRATLASAATRDVAPVLPTGPTVESYYREWYAARSSRVRPAQARDYRRHMENYVIPAIGAHLLADLKPKDVRGLQSDLLARVSSKTHKALSEKFTKNILCGTFQAMIRQARADEAVLCDPFVGLEWERWEHPEPEPFDAAERDAILGWFRDKRFSFHAGLDGAPHRVRPHPHYHAYLHLLFWHGARPSEASGFRWRHLDLRRGLAFVRESYHMGRYGKPKTKAAKRTIELHPGTVELLRAIKPLRESPEQPVFVTTTGGPIEPKNFSEHWYDCLRALGLRQRGLYATKDTAVSLALATGRDDMMLWLVQQTGVAIETLRRHYAKWIPKPDRGVWARLDPTVAEPKPKRLTVVS
jgi:integrase